MVGEISAVWENRQVSVGKHLGFFHAHMWLKEGPE